MKSFKDLKNAQYGALKNSDKTVFGTATANTEIIRTFKAVTEI